MANWTRFNGIDATTDGFAVGAKGSEVVVIDANGNVVSGAQAAITVGFLTSSAAQTLYTIAPYAGNVVAAYVTCDTAAVTAAYTIKAGSAGNTIASGSNTTVVAGTVTTLTLGTVAVTAGQSISLLRGTQGTAATSAVTIVIVRTS